MTLFIIFLNCFNLYYKILGINAIVSLSEEMHLAKGNGTKPGIRGNPEDLTGEEYCKILIKMLKEDKVDEVINITNQRSIVV